MLCHQDAECRASPINGPIGNQSMIPYLCSPCLCTSSAPNFSGHIHTDTLVLSHIHIPSFARTVSLYTRPEAASIYVGYPSHICTTCDTHTWLCTDAWLSRMDARTWTRLEKKVCTYDAHTIASSSFGWEAVRQRSARCRGTGDMDYFESSSIELLQHVHKTLQLWW